MIPPSKHPAFGRKFWVNLYPNGQMTGTVCKTKQEALNRCTWNRDSFPNAVQVQVKIVRLK